MNADEAEDALAETDVVPCLQAPIADMKEIREVCLAADIPVLLGREDACCAKGGGCGCAPKLQLLARAEDAPRIAHLLHERWRAMALAEGTVGDDHPAVAPAGDEPPCPACGTAAPLVGGACTDCGLQLEERGVGDGAANLETIARPSCPRAMRSGRKRLFLVAAAAIVVALAWAWPARRNYYFKRDAVERRLDVPYLGPASHQKQRLDLYLPRPAAAGFPVVVFVHGGYWSPFDRRWMQPLLGTFGNVGVAFARRGVAAAVIGYRQHPLAQSGDDSLADIAAAVRFVRDSCASWGCDAKRVFVVGHSAGGHLASLLALDGRLLRRAGVEADDIAGFASIDGIFDLAPSLAAFTPDQATTVRRLFGPDEAGLAARSTITYARAQHPPLLFVDSTGDEPVCRDGFRRMKARMAEVGSPARFVELPGLGHNEIVIRAGMDDDPLLPTLLAFVRQ